MITKTKNKLIGVNQLANWKTPAWLIDGMIPENSMTVLYGPPKGGKSFLALDWALRMAIEDKHVVYIAGEGLGGLGKRIRAWGNSYDPTVLKEPVPLLFPSMPVNLYSAGDAANFLELLRANEVLSRVEVVEEEQLELKGRVDLLVVDTLARCMIGADENDAGDVSLAIDHLDYIRRETGAAVLILHHSTKGNISVERGSTALRGAADVMLRLHRKDGTLKLEVEAARDFEGGKQWAYKTEKVGDSLVLAPMAAEELAAREAQFNGAPVQDEVLYHLTEGANDIATLVERTDRARHSVVKALEKLIRKGTVKRTGHGTYMLGEGVS